MLSLFGIIGINGVAVSLRCIWLESKKGGCGLYAIASLLLYLLKQSITSWQQPAC